MTSVNLALSVHLAKDITNMTRKDYQLIAQAVRKTMDGEYLSLAIIDIFIEELSADNPRFDAEKFRKACLSS